MVVTVSDITNVPVSTSALKWAAFTAIKKFPYTRQGFQTRTPFKILDDLFRGDLAKSALIEDLIANGATITNEYDQVRTDNFQKPNNTGFDFIANQTVIEVNSSLFPRNYSQSEALDLDIKITAGNNGRIHTYPLQLPFDVTVQLYFNFQTSFEDQNYSFQQLKNIANQLQSPNDELLDELINRLNSNNRYDTALLAYGWATKNDIENIRLANIQASQSPTWNFQNATRDYWNCRIKNANPYQQLFSYI